MIKYIISNDVREFNSELIRKFDFNQEEKNALIQLTNQDISIEEIKLYKRVKNPHIILERKISQKTIENTTSFANILTFKCFIYNKHKKITKALYYKTNEPTEEYILLIKDIGIYPTAMNITFKLYHTKAKRKINFYVTNDNTVYANINNENELKKIKKYINSTSFLFKHQQQLEDIIQNKYMNKLHVDREEWHFANKKEDRIICLIPFLGIELRFTMPTDMKKFRFFSAWKYNTKNKYSRKKQITNGDLFRKIPRDENFENLAKFIKSLPEISIILLQKNIGNSSFTNTIINSGIF